ncbi:M15 family metallopeptidase [Acetobacter cerevisiae]|uniref:D-alanyl-D-alanine dipeptidase n=2 Tax=Acetobacter cerevisiae TaxID=178900 RepID=A0ABT1ES76_9PROT|nr:M15 family metallopeptidase [Acetobacter cerevisiae]MCP1246089.1 M15 family metallopeptidase [Acetobacter cerevisiae]MCP1255562.1 M15 family metallopeptidase [Acetobacter cerevisiae]
MQKSKLFFLAVLVMHPPVAWGAQEDKAAMVFRITPVKPLEVLMHEALAASPPVQDKIVRAPDLVDLATLTPDFKFDIRYATTENFLSTPVYSSSHAFLEKPAAEALARASEYLKTKGYGLLIFDAYRPWFITKLFWDATPADKHQFVANPAHGSRHNRGCAVDLTLYDLKTGQQVTMPSGFDEMTPRAYSNYPDAPEEQKKARDLLRDAMQQEGFIQLPAEWWHFDYRDWNKYPVQNIRFEDIK